MSVISYFFLPFIIINVKIHRSNEEDTSHLTLKLQLISEKCNIKDKEQEFPEMENTISTNMEGILVDVSLSTINVTDPYEKVRKVASLSNSDLDLVIFSVRSNYSTELYKTLRSSSVSFINADKITVMENQTFLDGYRDTCPPFTHNHQGCAHDYNVTLVKQHGSSYLSNVFVSLVALLNWKETLIIYEQDFEFEMNNILGDLSARNVHSLLLKLGTSWTEQTTELFMEHVERIMKKGGNITLLCRHYCSAIINKNFKVIPENPYLHASIHLSRWLVIHINDIESVVETHNVLFDNVAIVSLPLSSTCNMTNTRVSVEEVTYEAIIRSTHRTAESAVANGNVNKRNIIDNLQAVIKQLSAPCTWYKIWTLMWISGSKRALTIVGQIRLSGELHLHSNIFPNTEYGFNGRRFIVSTLAWEPFVAKVNGTITEGICIDILRQLSQTLNFTYKIVEPADGEWGQMLPNKSFTGLIGLLERHEVDLLAAPLSVTYSREDVVDFIYPFFNEVTRIIQRKPNENDRKWRKLIDPFHPYVLLGLGICLPFASFLMSLFESVFPQYRDTPERHEDDGLHIFSNAFWYMYGALLTQGGEHMAESITGRLFLSTWWIFSITIMGIYSGNLIAFLTVSKETLDFSTMDDLFELDDYQWGFTGGTVWTDLFRAASTSQHMQFWEGVKKFNMTDPGVLSKDTDVHVNKVLEGNYAFLADYTYLQQLLRVHCELALSEDAVFQTQYAFALPNNSMFVKLFSKHMINIHELGLLEHWEYKVNTGFSPCESNMFQGNKPIEVSDVQSAFYLIAIGIFFALCSFLVECFIQKYRTVKRRKKLRRPSQNARMKSTSTNTDAVLNLTCQTCVQRKNEKNSKAAMKLLNVTADLQPYYKHTEQRYSSDILY